MLLKKLLQVKDFRQYIGGPLCSVYAGKSFVWNFFFKVHFATKVSLYFWNLQYVKFCVFWYPSTPYCEGKNERVLLQDDLDKLMDSDNLVNIDGEVVELRR
jgi:hypothetical protein